MKNQREGTRYVRNAQLAKYLDVSAMTVWRWQRDNTLDFPKPAEINGNPYTDLDLIDLWMKQRLVAPVARKTKKRVA